MSVPDQATELRLRRRPTQDRSVATFDLILDTTATLLDTHGFDALTTNLVAEESGTSIRAIYRYFPNKHAIVGELARRMEHQWKSALASAGDLGDPAQPWRDVWCAYIDAFVLAVRSSNGAIAVLAAMRADPQLRKIDEEANAGYTDDITAALLSRGRVGSASEARAIATVLMRSTVAVLDEAFEAGSDEADRLIATMKNMHIGLLSDYLD